MAIGLRKFISTSGIFSTFKNPSSVASCLLFKNSNGQFSSGRPQVQETVPDYTKMEDDMCKEVFAKVNDQITKKTHGRLFAIVQVQNSQYKITTEDLIVIRHNWPPTVGDKIRLEKVLLVGCSDFTLIGRPLLPMDQVSIIATVIEKTYSQTIHHLTYTPRKNNMKHRFFKDEFTFVRINSIDLTGKVNELGDTDGFKGRLFH